MKFFGKILAEGDTLSTSLYVHSLLPEFWAPIRSGETMQQNSTKAVSIVGTLAKQSVGVPHVMHTICIQAALLIPTGSSAFFGFPRVDCTSDFLAC